MSNLEWSACLVYGLSVLLAARNSIHTWWTGIIGCLLYALVFYQAKLYADVTLQVFFIITCISGWVYWLSGKQGQATPISTTSLSGIMVYGLVAILVAAAYGIILHRYTDAFAPFLDSLILTFSILAQCLLMRRKLENWYAWLIVNTIAVPLYSIRELYPTAILYGIFWLNTWHGLYQWRKAVKHDTQA